jgi:hypothetical protein
MFSNNLLRGLQVAKKNPIKLGFDSVGNPEGSLGIRAREFAF